MTYTQYAAIDTHTAYLRQLMKDAKMPIATQAAVNRILDAALKAARERVEQ